MSQPITLDNFIRLIDNKTLPLGSILKMLYDKMSHYELIEFQEQWEKMIKEEQEADDEDTILSRNEWESEFGSFYRETLPHRSLDDLYQEYLEESWTDADESDTE